MMPAAALNGKTSGGYATASSPALRLFDAGYRDLIPDWSHRTHRSPRSPG